MFYNKEEELAELQKQFQKKENFFLVAFSEEQQAFVGCMEILIRKDEAKTKRWEPLTFCDLTVQAFSTLEEDKSIHSWDPIVSNYEHCLELNKCIVAGMFGYSPLEF